MLNGHDVEASPVELAAWMLGLAEGMTGEELTLQRRQKLKRTS